MKITQTPNRKILLTAITVIAFPASKAAVTYVDATWGVDGNTIQWEADTALDAPAFPNIPSNGKSTTNNQWDVVAGGNGGFHLETSEANGENAPMLQTTIRGLEVGETYDIYAYFWAQYNSNNNGWTWRMQAGLEDNDLTNYISRATSEPGAGQAAGQALVSHYGVVTNSKITDKAIQVGAYGQDPKGLSYVTDGPNKGVENGGYFTNGDVLIWESDTRSMYEAYLGRVVVDASGEIHVYIDDQAGANNKLRTLYDGVGYSLVPEPGTALLALFGLVPFCRRRRR